MEKEFVPYSLALRMRLLGYDGRCFGWYYIEQTDKVQMDNCHNYCGWLLSGDNCSAPTWQSAFAWFREKYDLWSCIQKYPTSENPNRCYYELKGDNINTDKDESPNSYMSGWFNSYEEAELACLEKLIEIVEEK